EYENKSNNPITAQAKSMVKKKPRVLSSTTPSYYQTPQIGNTTNFWKSTPLESTQLDQITRRIQIAVWKSYPTESASSLMEETAILQSIGSSDKGKQPALAPKEHLNTRTPIPLNITSNTPPINQIIAYWDIAKLEKFSGEEDNTYSWIVDTEKAITANGWNDDHTIQALPFFLIGTANSWYQSLAEKSTSFTEFKLAFLQYFSIERDYYTVAQVFNQFIKGLWSGILRFIRSRHLTSLQDTVTLIRDFESTKQEANHTQAINLAINGTSDINTKITQLKKIITTANIHSNRTVNNSNNLGDPIPATQLRYQQNIIPQYSIPQNQLPLYTQQSPVHSTTTNDTSNPSLSNFPLQNLNNNQVQTNSGPSQPIPCGPAQSRPTPTGYLNQASYLGLMEDQATITKDTTLTTIFPFNINNLNTHSLFSGATINQDKPITVLYTDARVGKIDIKLILDSRSAGSIITKQLIDQLGCQIDRAATTQIITIDGNTKTPIREIDNFPFKINEIQIPTKVLVMEHAQVSWADDYRTELPLPPTWEKKRKGRAKEKFQLSSLEYKRALNRLDGYPHNDHKIWRMASAKAKDVMPEEIQEIKDNSWTPEYNGPDYPKNDFFTDNLDVFQNRY
ncbi:hypothetical protein G9A89_002590, partial [Geosiphon pyriformis]